MLRRYLSRCPMGCILAGAEPAQRSWSHLSEHRRPALRDHCASCHGPSLQTSKLRLDSRDALLKGGARGPAITPGDPANSLLLTAIEQSGKLKMPPGGKLPDATIAAIRRWIELGAPW